MDAARPRRGSFPNKHVSTYLKRKKVKPEPPLLNHSLPTPEPEPRRGSLPTPDSPRDVSFPSFMSPFILVTTNCSSFHPTGLPTQLAPT